MNKSIFLTSAARCGTHWVENILAYVLDLKIGLKRYIPNSDGRIFYNDEDYIEALKKEEEEKSGGFIYSAHIALNLLVPIIKFVNIIMLIRDPRDICISAAYFKLKNEKYEKKKFEQCLRKLLFDGGPNIDFNISSVKDKILKKTLYYEDMIKDSYGSLINVLDFFNYNYDKDRLKNGIEKYTFETLSKGRKPGEEDKSNHYRKGIIGDWKNYLSKEQNKEFCEKHKDLMKSWGYNE